MAVGGQRQAPAALLPGRRHVAKYTRDYVGPSNHLDGSGKPRLYRDSIPGP